MALLSSLLVAGTVASAQTPYENVNAFVSQLDLECRPPRVPTPPPAGSVTFTHLHPDLQFLGAQFAQFRRLDQTCVPVAKDGITPDPEVLKFIEHFDVACYDVKADPIPSVSLTVEHLNPVFGSPPAESVGIKWLERVCLPVSKVGGPVPADVQRLIAYADFACYSTTPELSALQNVKLDHLNPLIQQMNRPTRRVDVLKGDELCFPIEKQGAPVPEAERDVLQWVVFSAHDIVYSPLPANLGLRLKQSNPLYAGAPLSTVVLEPNEAELMVPVALNGNPPPEGPGGGGTPGECPECPFTNTQCVTFDGLALGPATFPIVEGDIVVTEDRLIVGGVPQSIVGTEIIDAWSDTPDNSIYPAVARLVFDFTAGCPTEVTFHYRDQAPPIVQPRNFSVNGSVPIETWGSGNGGTPPATWTQTVTNVSTPPASWEEGLYTIEACYVETLEVGAQEVFIDTVCANNMP